MKKRSLNLLLALLALHRVAAQSEFEFTHFNVTNTPVLAGNNFKSVAVTPKGAVWAGSQYHGLSKYDPATNSWSHSTDITDVLVTDIKTIGNDGIWLSQAGRSGTQGGGSNIAGGVNYFAGPVSGTSFYSITAPGALTSRNARSVWVDKKQKGPDGNFRVWVAQGTYISSNTTQAGGISVGLNTAANFFTKIYRGLQVTPNVPSGQAGTPNCISVGGYKDEVWICALANFGRSQILRYRADDPGTFIGYYDYTNTPALALGFRANVIFTDNQGRAWLGLNENGLRIKTAGGWKTMNDAAILPFGTVVYPNAISQDERGYIYFGTSSGLLMYKNGAVDSASSYQLVTTADGLPSNSINGVAADTINNRLVLAHTAGISFMKFSSKISSTMEWDHSFPKPAIKRPIAVAADGVARVFIKVRRGLAGRADIKKVKVRVKRNLGLASLTGALKTVTANAIAIYSNEANTGTDVEAERSDSTSNGDFFFWYVAPEDFSRDSLSNFASMGERNDTVVVKLTYSDNSEDSTNMPIKIVRPPLIMSSMVTKAVDKFKDFKLPDGRPLVDNDIYRVRQDVINGLKTYSDNESEMSWDPNGRETVQEREKRILVEEREEGIAVLRSDMITQGVTTRLVTKRIKVRRNTYYADGNANTPYNNYGKGYVNKLISVNAPLEGSPYFQALNDINTPGNELDAKQLSNILYADGGDMSPYPLMSRSMMGQSGLIRASVLFQKALIDSGAADEATDVKNHLITTTLGTEGVNNLGVRNKMLAGLNNYIQNDYSMMKLSPDANAMTYRTAANDIMATSLTQLQKADSFFSVYATVKGVQNFTKGGDFISSKVSQAAGIIQNLPHITNKTYSATEMVDHSNIFGSTSKTILNLLNTAINSPAFANSIPPSPVRSAGSIIGQKAARVLYDTAKIVITNRQELGQSSFRPAGGNGIENTSANDTTITVKYTVKDTVQLAHVRVNFQDQMFTSKSRNRNQEIEITVNKSFVYSGIQEITAVAVYQTADSIRYHADTVNHWTPKGEVQDFRIPETEMDLVDEILYSPFYEVKINDEWERLRADDPEINFVIENPSKLSFYGNTKSFGATGDGFSRIYFQYKTFKDTVAVFTELPWSVYNTNRSVASGSFKNAATWSKGRAPLPGDSVIISTGHTITLDTTLQIRSLKIETGATLSLNSNTLELKLGDAADGGFMIDNYGSLNISNGTLRVSGRVKSNAGATFNMTGGSLIIDGNTGDAINSMQNGFFLFEAVAGLQSFSFTGGTLQLVDPPIGLTSQAIFCPYNFGPLSTLVLGNGISVTASNNPNGFGGNGFPPQVGKLVLDASAPGSNRKLNITKPLSVKGRFEIRTGSNLTLQAPVTVSP